jgi:hypothetical protein
MTIGSPERLVLWGRADIGGTSIRNHRSDSWAAPRGNRNPVCRVPADRQLSYGRRPASRIHMRMDIKSFLIGVLLVAVVVLGYLYWDRQRNTVEIKLPSISIEKR